VNVFPLADGVQSETPVRKCVCVKRRSHMGGCLIRISNQELPLKSYILACSGPEVTISRQTGVWQVQVVKKASLPCPMSPKLIPCAHGGTLQFHSGKIPIKFKEELLLAYLHPFTGLDRPRGFQEVTIPRFHDNGTGWW